MSDRPIAYFITFTCYGTWLQGLKKTSVDKYHNTFGMPFMGTNIHKSNMIQKNMHQAPYLMNKTKRRIALDAINNTCIKHDWKLYAVHVRSNHVHVVLNAEINPEQVMNKFKCTISRELNKLQLDDVSVKRWTRHGSTKYLWKTGNVVAAVQYVVYQQGEPMEVSYDKDVLEFL